MPSRKLPVDVIVARGKSHLSKDEIEERRDQEITIPDDMRGVEIPEDLTTQKQQQEFVDTAHALNRLGIWAQIDADTLTRYILSKGLYLKYTRELNRLLNQREPNLQEISKIQNWQDKAFKQCHQCAQSLGMTITSRCRIIVPQSQVNDDDLEL